MLLLLCLLAESSVLLFDWSTAQQTTVVPNFPVNASGHCSFLDNVTGCLYDCESSAIGKACGQDQVFCDAAFSSTGCGKCVSDVTTCIDRRYQRLCDTSVNDGAPIFQCASTLNCVLFSWINDGVNDCGDFSDEDPCLNGYNCSQKLLSTVSQVTICTCNNLLVTNGTLWQVNDTMFKNHVIGRCQKNPLQFDCGDTNNTCIDMNLVRNCRQDCPNGADETCWTGLATCPDKCRCVAPSNVSACPALTTTAAAKTQYVTTIAPMNVTIPTCYDLACIYNICAVINASTVCNNVTEQSIMIIHDCADLAVFALLYGARLVTGTYLVFNATCSTLNDSCLIPVFCDMDQDADGGYTVREFHWENKGSLGATFFQVIQRRNSGNLSFAKSWNEYKGGFGAFDSEFWIGNDYVSMLTNRPGSNGSYELLILVKNSSGVASKFKYNKFGIGKESTYYHLMLGSLVSGTPDNLVASRYRPFATYDKDNKVNGGALLCASYWQSGWWMDVSCRDVGDLNAPMVYDIRQPYLKGVQWSLAGQKTPKIIETIMMIRPTWFTSNATVVFKRVKKKRKS